MDKRIKIEDEHDKLQITILSKKIWPIIVLLFPWIFFLLKAEKVTILGILNSNKILIFIYLWTIAWTVGIFLFIKILLWFLFGKESISISRTTISVQRSILGIGPIQEYSIFNVENFRIRNRVLDKPKKIGSKILGVRNPDAGFIKFKYNYKTIGIADEVSKIDAQKFLNIIKDKKLIPESSFFNNQF